MKNNGNAEKEYIIGHVPTGMGKQLGKEGLGLQWNEEIGWHTKDPEKAKAARAIILENQPRYYLEGDTYAARDLIAKTNKAADSPEGKIFYDPYVKKRYAISLETHEAVQAQIPAKPEKKITDSAPNELSGASKAQEHTNTGGKYYIPNVPFELNKQMRELGCKWDPDAKSWYHTDPIKAKEAERLVNEALEKSSSSIVPAVVEKVTHEM